MAAHEPAPGRPPGPSEDPQDAVAQARAHVLRGHGPGVPKADYDRYKRERPTLGPLPAPLARELVHLQTARIRSGLQPDVDDTSIRNQVDRMHELWRTTPAEHPRTLALTRVLRDPAAEHSAPPPHPASPQAPAANHPTSYLAVAALGTLAGAAAAIVLRRGSRPAVDPPGRDGRGPRSG